MHQSYYWATQDAPPTIRRDAWSCLVCCCPNFGGGTGAQRPNIVGDPYDGWGESLTRWFNVDAFERITTPGGICSAPVNAVRGPGSNNWDISLLKNIRLSESMKFQIGAESFNTFNHSQFEDVGGQVGSAAYGVVTSARDPRVIQLRAKFSF